MRVAVVHDWITGMRGGERVLESVLKLIPNAEVYTLLHVPHASSALIDAKVKGTSIIQKLPFAKYYYRFLLPFFPLAAWSINLKNYDLVISLSHAAAKNVRIQPGTRHICLCFTPMRYIWDQAPSYFGFLRFLLWPLILWLRAWDRRGAQRVDGFIAISRFIAARIRCFYKRSATVIYPAIDAEWLTALSPQPKSDFYLYAGALVPYKRVDLIIKSFLKDPTRKLVIAGVGPDLVKLKQLAQGAAHIEFVGRPSDTQLKELYSTARALIFAATEDFGLIPLEALARGCPVIAHHSGALRETLRGYCSWKDATLNKYSYHPGIYFKDLTEESLLGALKTFEQNKGLFPSAACRAQAEKFAPETFNSEFLRFVTPTAMGSAEDERLSQ